MINSAEVITAYWDAANARDWAAFGALLTGDVVYEMPQTRERIRGLDAYLQFNIEYPGDWHATPERIIGQGRHAASWNRFQVDGTEQHALCFFDFDNRGLITTITDFWPEPYEPPTGREHLTERF